MRKIMYACMLVLLYASPLYAQQREPGPFTYPFGDGRTQQQKQRGEPPPQYPDWPKYRQHETTILTPAPGGGFGIRTFNCQSYRDALGRDITNCQ